VKTPVVDYEENIKMLTVVNIEYGLEPSISFKIAVFSLSGRMLAPAEAKSSLSYACTFLLI